MSDTNSQRKQRRSARAILLSPANDVLLIHFVVPRSGGDFAFWAPPGGETEEGEDCASWFNKTLYSDLMEKLNDKART